MSGNITSTHQNVISQTIYLEHHVDGPRVHASLTSSGNRRGKNIHPRLQINAGRRTKFPRALLSRAVQPFTESDKKGRPKQPKPDRREQFHRNSPSGHAAADYLFLEHSQIKSGHHVVGTARDRFSSRLHSQVVSRVWTSLLPRMGKTSKTNRIMHTQPAASPLSLPNLPQKRKTKNKITTITTTHVLKTSNSTRVREATKDWSRPHPQAAACARSYLQPAVAAAPSFLGV